MPYPYSLDDYIAQTRRYIAENNLIKPHVIAHSFGGRVAVKAAATDSELFGKIVLTGGAGLKPRRSVKYKINQCRFRLAKRFLPREKLERFYSSDYRALSPVMRESFKKIVGEHLDGIAAAVKNPVLLLYGANDTETPLYMARRYNALIRGSQLQIIGNAGHFCFLEKPTAFSALVREFLLE